MAEKKKGLPKFEGQEVKQRELAVTGSVAIPMQAEDPHSIDDKFVFIGTATVKSIAHQRKGDANVMTRIEKGAATEMYVVLDSVDVEDLLQRVRAEREQALDELLGRQKLPLEAQDAATDSELDRLLEEEAAREAAEAAGIDTETGEVTKPTEMTDDEWEQSLRDGTQSGDGPDGDTPEDE